METCNFPSTTRGVQTKSGWALKCFHSKIHPFISLQLLHLKMFRQQNSKICGQKNVSPLTRDGNRHVLPLEHIGHFQFSLGSNWGRCSLSLWLSYSFPCKGTWPPKQSVHPQSCLGKDQEFQGHPTICQFPWQFLQFKCLSGKCFNCFCLIVYTPLYFLNSW